MQGHMYIDIMLRRKAPGPQLSRASPHFKSCFGIHGRCTNCNRTFWSQNLESQRLKALKVGIAAELPSGEHSSTNLGYEDFHDFLMAKKDSYVKIPPDRMNVEA